MRRLILFAALFTLLTPALAYGDQWEDAPVYDLPGWGETLPGALNYWAPVTGQILQPDGSAVAAAPQTLDKACPGGLTLHLINTTLNANAWGRTSSPGHPDCKIWIEQRFVDATEKMSPGWRERVRCAAFDHEVGHVLGLPHEFRGDPLNILGPWPGQIFPQHCINMWPNALNESDSGTGFKQEQERQAQQALANASQFDYYAKDATTKDEARSAARKKLGKGWKIRAEVTGNWEDMWTGRVIIREVTVAAVRKTCKGHGKKRLCKTQKRRYQISRTDGELDVSRVPW